jgi:hypothetical protein
VPTCGLLNIFLGNLHRADRLRLLSSENMGSYLDRDARLFLGAPSHASRNWRKGLSGQYRLASSSRRIWLRSVSSIGLFPWSLEG